MNDFSKKRRLLEKSDYDHVFQQAQKLTTPEFVFLYRCNSVGHARLGLALSKKNIAKSHDRNRIKRLLRETFRREALPAIDIVVLGRRGVATTQNSAMLTKLGKAWEKLIILCTK